MAEQVQWVSWAKSHLVGSLPIWEGGCVGCRSPSSWGQPPFSPLPGSGGHLFILGLGALQSSPTPETLKRSPRESSANAVRRE